MKTSQTISIFIILFLSLMIEACNKKEIQNSNQTRNKKNNYNIEQLKQEIHDSIRTLNADFVQRAIIKGKSLAKDSDDYYDLTMYNAILDFYLAKPDSVLVYLNQCINYLSRNVGNPKRNNMHIKCLQTKAAIYAQFYLNSDSMIHYNIQACKVAEQNPDSDIEERILCYNNLADAYKQKGELAQSAFFYRKAIFLADSIHTSKDNYVSLYSGIATTYIALRDFEQSKIWLDKSLELWDCMMVHEQFNYFNNRGNDYYYQNDYKNSLNTFLQLDTFLKAYPELEWEKHICHANLVDIYLKFNQPEKAKDLLHDNILFFQKMQAETVLLYLYTQQMELALQQNDDRQVEQLIHNYPLPEGTRPEHALTRFEFLEKYYVGKNNWEKAFYYQQIYRDLDDSLRNDRVKMRTVDLQMRYERDATVLNQKIYIGQKETELLQTYIWLTVSIAILSLLIALLYYHRKQSKLKEDQMLHRIVGLRMENIRNRITPHFIYNALNHELLAQQQGKPSQLHILVNLLRQGQMLANVFCTSLKEEMDFIQLYVQIEGEALGDNFDYNIILEDDINPEQVCLPSMMIQIFVENAIKHGLKNLPNDEEKKLTIQISRKNNGIEIEVRNNGKALSFGEKDKKAQTGLRVVSQTIQLLNERNDHLMSYSLTDYRDEKGETGCSAQLFIPDNYNFDIN